MNEWNDFLPLFPSKMTNSHSTTTLQTEVTEMEEFERKIGQKVDDTSVKNSNEDDATKYQFPDEVSCDKVFENEEEKNRVMNSLV